MGEWLSDNRALIAAYLIIGLVITFVISIFIGRREAVRRAVVVLWQPLRVTQDDAFLPAGFEWEDAHLEC